MSVKTRQIYEVYVLELANMHGGVDKAEVVAIFSEHQKLKDWYNSQLADKPYTDTPSKDNFGQTHSWHKVFKKGSPLEWYNPANSLEEASCQGGVRTSWVNDYPTRETINNNYPFDPVD